MAQEWLKRGGLLLASGLVALGLLRLLQPLDDRLMDALVRVHAGQQRPDPELLLVDIDDYSLGKMNAIAGRWPWPRAQHAEVLEAVAAYGPRLVAFDILFSDSDAYMGGESDAYFAEVLAKLGKVLLPVLHQQGEPGHPGPLLSDYPPHLGLSRTPAARPDARAHLLLPYAIPPELWKLGSINFVADADGIGRRYDVYRDLEGWRLPSLPAKLVSELGLPLPDEPRIVLNWRGRELLPFDRLPYYDLHQLIAQAQAGDGAAGRRLREALGSRIVLIGASASGLYDLRPTPIASQQPALAILATAVDNLKNGNWYRTLPALWPALLALGLLAFCAGLFLRLRGDFGRAVPVAGLGLGLASALAVALSYALLIRHRQLPVGAALAVAWLGYAALAIAKGTREFLVRRRTVALFSRFMDPKVVAQLVAKGSLDPANLTRSCTLTVLFSDIRGFTTLSEELAAEDIVALLNRYFALQLRVVFKHGGTLDKFIGDAIMAFWGAPAEDPAQAERAIAAALEMCAVLEAFRAEMGSLGARFDVGIGIHTGPAVVGMIGSSMRYDYTAIGDTVNLASRIEGLTKGVARVLVSESTRDAAAGAYAYRAVGEHTVKGRHAAVRLYEPCPAEAPAQPENPPAPH